MELGNFTFGNSRGEYPVDRSWQDAFVTKLYDMEFDSYGLPKKEESAYKGEFKVIKSKAGDSRYFENEVFMIMPYYWGDDDELSEMPNFIHKASGFHMSWYKYALRDSYMNKEISFVELMDIMEDCKKSIGFNDVPFTYKKTADFIGDALGWLENTDNQEKTNKTVEQLRVIKKELMMK